ncbi:MAG: septal ring lytic transglycosylase RlpA family protein [Candidatus Omnitrophica bacterium]|nr:septal ring lytic transglycosylase RlpA family protein [Candidatus Omnitrophota bacterium]
MTFANINPPKVKTTVIRVGQASWYSEQSPGINKRTANNEIFNDRDMTCALWDVPFNKKIKITNLDNGKSIVVRVNDRGPHKRYVKKGRIIDLTKNAFRKISALEKGLIDVQIEFL